MRVVLREHGFEPTEELLEMYHQVNGAAWAAFERGEVTKEKLWCASGSRLFGKLGRQVDGAQVESMYRGLLDKSAILIDGALEVCGYLRDRYRLYIVTNGTSSTQYKRLAASGLDCLCERHFRVRGRGEPEPQRGVL